MKKDGYYFISDYGMQINILTRYGIRNYAIVEKDYLFINGDPFDFRYENIQIIQQYYGVEKVIFRGTERYLAKIHVNGYYQIGRYQTPLDAAIAYNKAIDILHKKGYQKNYSINYISTLSNAEYANRYYELPISKKILCLPNKK